MTRRRTSSRTFSYSKKFSTSASPIVLCATSILDSEPVCLGEQADGMDRAHPGALADLERSQGTVGRNPLRPNRLDGPEERLRELHRELEILLLHSPRSVDARTLLDGLHSSSCQPQHIGGLGSQILRLEVTRELVGDRCRRVREVGIELARGVEPGQVFAEIARVAGDQI